MCEMNVFPPASFLYRREALTIIGQYRDDVLGIGDWEFNLRFMSHFDIFLVPHALTFYHLRRSGTGPEGNTVIQGHGKHELYNTYLRNDLLREGIQSGTESLGGLINRSHQFALATAHLDQIDARITASESQIAQGSARLGAAQETLAQIIGEVRDCRDQVNQIAQQVSGIQTQVNQTFDSLVSLVSLVAPPSPASPDAAGDGDTQAAPGHIPAWFAVSVFRFLASREKRGLVRKFMRRLREDGPRRALQVVVRFGYLSGRE